MRQASQSMANPTEDDWGKIKKIVRYLKGCPSYVNRFRYQEDPNSLTAWSDSDFAGCLKARKSTSGGAVKVGECLIKTWSTTQSSLRESLGWMQLR